MPLFVSPFAKEFVDRFKQTMQDPTVREFIRQAALPEHDAIGELSRMFNDYIPDVSMTDDFQQVLDMTEPGHEGMTSHMRQTAYGILSLFSPDLTALTPTAKRAFGIREYQLIRQKGVSEQAIVNLVLQAFFVTYSMALTKQFSEHHHDLSPIDFFERVLLPMRDTTPQVDVDFLTQASLLEELNRKISELQAYYDDARQGKITLRDEDQAHIRAALDMMSPHIALLKSYNQLSQSPKFNPSAIEHAVASIKTAIQEHLLRLDHEPFVKSWTEIVLNILMLIVSFGTEHYKSKQTQQAERKISMAHHMTFLGGLLGVKAPVTPQSAQDNQPSSENISPSSTSLSSASDAGDSIKLVDDAVSEDEDISNSPT